MLNKKSKMGTINNTISNLQAAYGDYINIPKVYKVLFDKYINYPEIKEALDPELEDAIKAYEQHLKDEEERRKAEMANLLNGDDLGSDEDEVPGTQERVADPDLEPKEVKDTDE